MKPAWLTIMLTAASLASLPAHATGDLPPVGHSRFDQLVGDKPLPYPFSRLLRSINRQMRSDAGGLPPLKVTLIPLGRSLQRDAGAPDFFHYPRVVAAADGDALPGIAPLKDRLFIGYHEKGDVIEVISYNDAAGRFEFQVVRDYRAGTTPQLFYARRSLCLSCHQNAAPIFARPLWDETPANPAIAQRLRETRRDFYQVRLTGTDIAYFIDNATDRANLFSVWQQMWLAGCGNGNAGDRCRLEAFAAALDYARNRTLPAPPSLATLAHDWTQRWPSGLSIPNPDLPNRDPLAALPDPAHDPLLLRPPLETWRAPDKTAFVVGLAGMLDAASIRQLSPRADLAAPLERLLARGALGARPFSHHLVDHLLAELGTPRRAARIALPPARVEPPPQENLTHTPFRIHCASCHDTTLPHPPNFLHGSAAAVEARLTHCAARIFVRLSMAETTSATRGTTPMPPPSALARRGISPHQWARSPELAVLKRSIETRLGDMPRDDLLKRPYAQLPPCLPPSRYGERTP